MGDLPAIDIITLLIYNGFMDTTPTTNANPYCPEEDLQIARKKFGSMGRYTAEGKKAIEKIVGVHALAYGTTPENFPIGTIGYTINSYARYLAAASGTPQNNEQVIISRNLISRLPPKVLLSEPRSSSQFIEKFIYRSLPTIASESSSINDKCDKALAAFIQMLDLLDR